ncbi:hypothetical protein lerEdw1_009781 [Lerista edwardsae]|nr:hypothetical protein lerEdw1_009781 [Lerista edwardsae]
MKVLLTTCLLCALLPAVASLTCYMCAGQKPACKKPATIECEDEENVCVTVTYGLSVGEFRILNTIIKTCAESKFWKTDHYGLTTDTISLFANMHTCTTNLCNNKEFRMPPRSELELNGRKCPACMSFESDHCQSDKVISCRANETACVNFGIKARTPGGVQILIGAQGCATKNYCNYTVEEWENIGHFMSSEFTHLKCDDAPLSGSSGQGGPVRSPHPLWSLPFMGMEQRGQKPSG